MTDVPTASRLPISALLRWLRPLHCFRSEGHLHPIRPAENGNGSFFKIESQSENPTQRRVQTGDGAINDHGRSECLGNVRALGLEHRSGMPMPGIPQSVQTNGDK